MGAHLQRLDESAMRSPANRREGDTSDGRNPDLAEAERLVMDAEMEERDRLEEAEESADESRPQETEFAESQQKSGPCTLHATRGLQWNLCFGRSADASCQHVSCTM